MTRDELKKELLRHIGPEATCGCKLCQDAKRMGLKVIWRWGTGAEVVEIGGK